MLPVIRAPVLRVRGEPIGDDSEEKTPHVTLVCLVEGIIVVLGLLRRVALRSERSERSRATRRSRDPWPSGPSRPWESLIPIAPFELNPNSRLGRIAEPAFARKGVLMSNSVQRLNQSQTSVPLASAANPEAFAVGIDVSQQHLDLDEYPAKNYRRFEYTTDAHTTT